MATFGVDVYRQALQNVTELRDDPYALFNVREDSTLRELKEAYMRLALVTHPDKNTEPGAGQAFAVVKELYARLRKERAQRGGHGARPEPSMRSDKWWAMHSWYQDLAKQADWEEGGGLSGSDDGASASGSGRPRKRGRRRRHGSDSGSDPASDPEEESKEAPKASTSAAAAAPPRAPQPRPPPKGDPRLPVPLAPEIASKSGNQLAIRWRLPEGTKEPDRWQYAVFVNGRMAVDRGPTAACVLRGLTPGAEYAIEVGCVDGRGLLPPAPGTRSPPLVTRLDNAPPSTPSSVRVELCSRHSLKIRWSVGPNAQPVTLYEIRLDGVVFRSKDPTGPEFTAMGLEAGTEYEVEIRATNASGASGWSKPVTLRTMDPSDSGSQ